MKKERVRCLTLFLQTLEFEIKNTPSATQHTHTKEGLRYKPNKIGIVFPYAENYKTQMKEIKYLTKWRDIPCL